MKNFIESSVPNNILQRLDLLHFFWRNELSESCLKCLIESMAKFLSSKKNKDRDVAVVLRDLNDVFVFGAYVTFVEQTEEGSEEGVFNLNYTFEETDIDPKTMEIIKFNSPEMRSVFEDTAYIKDGIVWKFQETNDEERPCEASSTNINCIIMNAIKEYMEANINFDNQLTLAGYITFTAEAESGGKIYIACEPSAVIKQFLKSDSMLKTVVEE